MHSTSTEAGAVINYLGAEYPSPKNANLFIIVGLYKPQEGSRLPTQPLRLESTWPLGELAALRFTFSGFGAWAESYG